MAPTTFADRGIRHPTCGRRRSARFRFVTSTGELITDVAAGEPRPRTAASADRRPGGEASPPPPDNAKASMLGPRTGRTYTRLTSIEDWNREFSELVRRGAGEPGGIAPAAGEQAVKNDLPASNADSDHAIAERRLSIAARLVRLGFIAS